MVLVRQPLESVFATLSSCSVLSIPQDTRRDNWARTVHNQTVDMAVNRWRTANQLRA
jgi:hypothetical protein